VALPTCGLALAESERVFPDVLAEVDKILAELSLLNEPILIRMTVAPMVVRDPTMPISRSSVVLPPSTRCLSADQLRANVWWGSKKNRFTNQRFQPKSESCWKILSGTVSMEKRSPLIGEERASMVRRRGQNNSIRN
jgi:hypothetical protein